MHITLFAAEFYLCNCLIMLKSFKHSDPNKYNTNIFSLRRKYPVVACKIRCGR